MKDFENAILSVTFQQPSISEDIEVVLFKSFLIN